jgi:hypothetical protein
MFNQTVRKLQACEQCRAFSAKNDQVQSWKSSNICLSAAVQDIKALFSTSDFLDGIYISTTLQVSSFIGSAATAGVVFCATFTKIYNLDS